MEKYCPNTKFLSNTTKFTLCVYWTHRANGVPYTGIEMDLNKHRKYIDSYDYVNTIDGRTMTRHDEAYFKLLAYVERNKAHVQRALIFLNDFGEGKQHLIASLSHNEIENRIVMPHWFKSENPFSDLEHVYAGSLQSPALKTYELVQRVLQKKPISINDLKQAA